jgi:hypothetical protein
MANIESVVFEMILLKKCNEWIFLMSDFLFIYFMKFQVTYIVFFEKETPYS